MPDPVSFLSGAANWLTGNLAANKSSEYKGSLRDFAEYSKQKYKEGKFGLTDYDKAFLYNSSIAAYQNDLALQNWNRENEYNSPEAQMQRYLDAGLNPNLVYGAGASSGNAGNIGTPTVGGQVSPTDIQDSRTRRRAQSINAAQTAIGMLSQSADLFQKLMTIKGTIQAQNAQSAGNAAIGLYNRDYWNWLRPKSLDAATAKVSGWNADSYENLLRERMSDYRLNFHNSDEKWMDENGNYGTPYFVSELQTRLQNSQADLQYQGLQNAFQEILNKVAGNPVFGKAALASKEVELLDKKIALSGIQWLLENRSYNWMPFKNIGGIIGGLWPKIGLSFGKSSKDITYHKNY